MTTSSQEDGVESEHPTFSVDTHLFRELGELLVGRDSTALVELIKNSYDADATEVIVYGQHLDDPIAGFITIRDNGTGMDEQEFRDGFLRIASRTKDVGERRSRWFARRFTGAKGVGRLAAHKLAHTVEVASLRWNGKPPEKGALRASGGVEATIRWDVIEEYSTLAELAGTHAITVHRIPAAAGAAPRSGTTITLRQLRRSWSSSAHTRFLDEIQTFDVPAALARPVPKSVLPKPLLFKAPLVRDSKKKGPALTFSVTLEGELAAPDDFWQAQVDAANWIIEIDADRATHEVKYSIAPTARTLAKLEGARPIAFTVPHPSPDTGPFFQARILLRTGKTWGGHANGIRVFLEGFRVLPYGEPRNDWLGLDRDVTERGRGLLSLSGPESPYASVLPADVEEGLIHLPNKHYFGAVFLTQESAQSLRMLVNREGFVPDTPYDTMTRLVRAGIDMATRARAAATVRERETRRIERKTPSPRDGDEAPETIRVIRNTVIAAKASAAEARRLVAAGNVKAAQDKLNEALTSIDELTSVSDELMSEMTMLRVLASVGTQLAGFVHEINGLVGTAEAVDRVLRDIRKASLARSDKRGDVASLNELVRIVADLRRSLERQASYLVDVVTPDARRRRSRQILSERFDAGVRLVAHVAEKRSIQIRNDIPRELKSPAMFPAELSTIFSNLLTNAVKAAGNEGRIRGSGRKERDGRVILRIENSGVGVRLSESERWFQPFESTTSSVDAVLGQGMGLGLPITRSMLSEYGGQIRFVSPTKGFRTAVEITFPGN